MVKAVHIQRKSGWALLKMLLLCVCLVAIMCFSAQSVHCFTV